MPKTKLDRMAIPPKEIRRRIIRAAGCRAGVCRDKDLAEAAGIESRRLSDRYNGKVIWSADDLSAIDRVVGFTDSELAQIIRGKFQ